MIKLITVGKIKEKYLKDAILEYTKRISKYTKLEIIELQDYDYDNKQIVLEKEKENIIKHINGIHPINSEIIPSINEAIPMKIPPYIMLTFLLYFIHLFLSIFFVFRFTKSLS